MTYIRAWMSLGNNIMLSVFSKMTLTLKIEIFIIICKLCFARYKSWSRGS